MKFVILSFATIGDALREWFGLDVQIPIQTYGFFVAIAFITGAFIMSHEYKRKENEGLIGPIYKVFTVGEKATTADLIKTFLIAFVIGYKFVAIIFNYSEFANNAQDFLMSGRGSWAGGIIVGLASAFYTFYDKNKKKLPTPKKLILRIYPHQMAGNILIVTGIFGLLGAKIFHNLENWDRFVADPIGELFSFSGLTFFGGLIVGGFAGWWYLKKNNLSSFHTLDCAAAGLPFAYAMGRVGCQCSGDGCWGIENTSEAPSWIPDWAWSSQFPHNVINAGEKIADCNGSHCHILSHGVYPTSLYETLMMLVIFAIIFFGLNKKIKLPGMIFGIYLTLQGIERMLIEQIRVNNKFHLFGMEVTQAEIIATCLIISGITVTFLCWKFKDKIAEITKYKEEIPDIKAEIVDKID